MKSLEMKTDATYIVGHPETESVRLQRAGQLLYASTKQLFEQAGILPGMKVLDVGCGAGDVALLLAELIGPTGSLVGIDAYPRVLEVARARLHASGMTNATFLAGDIRKLELENDFDAVVGRNVLMYMADPAEVLRICASYLHPGGVIAFEEAEWSILEGSIKIPSMPPLARQLTTWTIDGFRQSGVEMQMSFRFPQFFVDAGLPSPEITLNGIVGTENDWVGYDFLADVLRDILPKLYEYGILGEPLDAVTYITRLREEICQYHTCFPLAFRVGAWAYKGQGGVSF